uniref:CHK kinase-like domain-containing protein n=1 Tax=Plectus sambesii TaxID=2011161 RepID=A0A914WBD9_9BILA
MIDISDILNSNAVVITDCESKPTKRDLSKRKIKDSDFSVSWVERTLQFSLKTHRKFGPNLSVERIGAGQGNLSTLLQIVLDWQGVNGEIADLPSSVVLKIPSMKAMEATLKKLFMNKKNDRGFGSGVDIQSAMRAFENSLHKAHAAEVAFFRFCTENMSRAPEIQVPNCFFAQKFDNNDNGGILILEDLRNAAAVKPIYEGLSISAIKQILDALAKIHALSLENTQWTSDLDMNCSITEINKLSKGQYEKMRRTMAVSLKTNYPKYFDGLIDKFLDSFSLNSTLVYDLHKEVGIPPVLVHGDLWMNNMLWRRCDGNNTQDETTDQLLAIIDWQLVHPGCVSEDLVRLFCSSVSPEIRRNHLHELLEYYHICLRDALGREPPFSVDHVKETYSRLFRFGVMCIVPGFAAWASFCFLRQPQGNFVTRYEADAIIFKLNQFIACGWKYFSQSGACCSLQSLPVFIQADTRHVRHNHCRDQQEQDERWIHRDRLADLIRSMLKVDHKSISER